MGVSDPVPSPDLQQSGSSCKVKTGQPPDLQGQRPSRSCAKRYECFVCSCYMLHAPWFCHVYAWGINGISTYLKLNGIIIQVLRSTQSRKPRFDVTNPFPTSGESFGMVHECSWHWPYLTFSKSPDRKKTFSDPLVESPAG